MIAEQIIGRALNADLPEEITDPHGYIRHVNEHLARLLERVSEIPPSMPWDVITPERFAQTTASLSGPAKLGAFWLDQTNQALILSALTAWKARSLVDSFVRCMSAGELIAPALLSRAMMELATSTLSNLRETIGVLRAVAASEKPIAVDPGQMQRIEETLQRAIWGTRIGSSMLPDKTRLWSRSPYEGTVEATNVLTAFQKVAREAGDPGAIAFKVYEWLCDIVHPATQGLRVFWESFVEIAPGHRRFNICSDGSSDQSVICALVLWAASYSAVTLFNTIGAVSEAINGVRARLPTTYHLPVKP